MSLLKSKQVAKMSPKEREEKLKDLKMELIRGKVAANKSKAKTKEIKRAVARILTFNKSSKDVLLGK